MDLGRTEEQRAAMHRSGRPVTVSALLVVAISAVFSSAGSDFASGADAALAPLAPHRQVLREPAWEPISVWADGAIDSLEDDDFSCEQPIVPSIQRTGSEPASSARAPRFASGELAQTYPARGPPST